MPIFVHLAPANMVAHIRRVGIKHGRRGVFCMPMLPGGYYSSHQWARELRRRGQRTMMAISFRLDESDEVSVGVYKGEHRTMSASEAVKTLMDAENLMEYEVIVPHAISAKAIHSVRTVPHTLGWRFYPLAHGHPTHCLCHWCSRGEINRQRNKRYQEKRTRKLQTSDAI